MKIQQTLLALLLATTSLTHAKVWDDKSINALSHQATTAINQLIKKDPQSEIYRLLSADQVHHLQTQIDNQNITFTQIVQSVFNALEKRYLHSQALPYAALRHELIPVTATAVPLYEYLMQEDDDALAYAFAKLDALNLQGKWLEKRKELHRRYGFFLRSADLDNEQDNPDVCLEFSQRLRPEPAQNWKTLINITPTPRAALTYRGRKVCFGGQWQTSYTINIDKSLQSEHRLMLTDRTTESVNTGNRPPMMRFATSGYVLDENNNQQLALSTANIDNVEVTLWKIPANNLSNERIQRIIKAPQDISTWRLERLLSREGVQRFNGTFAVGKYAANETVTTNIAFADLMKDKTDNRRDDSGIYVLTARNADTRNESTQIAFSVTNAGFSAYLTDEGLWAELRDLKSTKPLSGQAVTLYSLNNSVLGTAETDKNGVAHFDKPQIIGKDGLAPSHVMSENGELFAYLNINDTPVDLSDKGLSGTMDNAPLRTWIWSDRGIYRPNDTAHLMWLTKNLDGKAFNSAPIWLELLRPDGKLMLEQQITADDSGAYSFDYYFDNAVRQGDWKIRLSLGKDGAFLAEKTLPVAAITPQQVEAKITPFKNAIFANQAIELDVQADWLYGAPASDLSVAVTQTIREANIKDDHWNGWQIGLHDEKRYFDRENLDAKTTNSEGVVSFSANTNDIPFSSKPLELAFTAHVTEPSGQVVQTHYTAPLLSAAPHIGLKSDGSKTVQARLWGGDGTQPANWQLFRVHYDYYWYKKDGDWHYQPNENRELVKTGETTLNADSISKIDLPIDDGAYVLVVRGEAAETAASIPLEFGYYASPAKGSAPDRITVSSDKVRYLDGEKVKLHLSAPFDGRASVKFAHNDTIVANELVDFSDGKAELTFKWDEKWNDGLWLLANAWNEDQQNAHNRRAVGLHWVGGDLSPYTLNVSTQLPESIEPNTTLTIPLSIPKDQLNGKTWARVAVIDEGLYQLAKASFSNPLDAFWSKKQLNANFYDVWGDIIRQIEARQAALRSGADGMLGDNGPKALPELDLQLVTYWSKPVSFDSDGNASVQMDIPQFNGRLRVMSAVWNDEKLGSVEQTLAVRAPLVATLYTPPYLSPNDQSSLRVRLHNTTDTPMTLAAGFDPRGLQLAGESEGDNFTLAPDEEKWLKRNFQIPADAKRSRAEVSVNVGDVVLKRFMDIRPKHAPQKSQQLAILGAKQHLDLNPIGNGSLFERNVFLSTNAPFDPENILTQLSNYPYGCNEQITSKSWNNLLLGDLIPKYALDDTAWGDAAQRDNKLQTAHRQLANRQSADGSFSLWGYENAEDAWLSAYVSEFLLDAKNAGKLSNTLALDRALKYLRRAVMNARDENATATAYAHYVLAKAGEPVQGAALRFGEARANDVALSTATLHTVSALVNHGEMALATQLLNDAVASGYNDHYYAPYHHYGAKLRNVAQSLAVAYELLTQLETQNADNEIKTATQEAIVTLLPELISTLRADNYYSTQDLHWLAALASRFPNADATAAISINGKATTVKGTQMLRGLKDDIVNIVNNSDTPVYVTQSDWRIPQETQSIENGYQITMRYEDKNGQAVDISQLKQNQQVIAIATITLDKGRENADLMFSYPLPAGLTAETFDAQSSNGKSWEKWLALPQFSENRDDRHLAAFNTNNYAIRKAGKFEHVFMLRAARKGTWHAPEYSVQDMYQPQYRAVKAIPAVTVE